MRVESGRNGKEVELDPGRFGRTDVCQTQIVQDWEGRLKYSWRLAGSIFLRFQVFIIKNATRCTDLLGTWEILKLDSRVELWGFFKVLHLKDVPRCTDLLRTWESL